MPLNYIRHAATGPLLIVAVLIYVVFLVAQVAIWIWWQNRGKRAAAAETAKATATSEYGRPLVRKN